MPLAPTSSIARRLTLGLGLAAGLALMTFGPLGCGGGDEGSSSPGGSSTVDVDGSSTVFKISDLAREEYLKVDSGSNVVVNNHGTGGGFGRYLKGEVDVVDASRAAKPEEEEKAKAQGIDWTRFLVGYDGIAVVVNAKNDFAKSFSVAQLKRIFEPGSTVTTWKDLDPSWPDRKIIVYTPDKDSGTFEFFTEKVNGAQGKQRDGVQASPDDNFLVRGVGGDLDGIGYFGFAYYAANKDKLRAVPVSAKEGAPAIDPTPETILDKTYAPLARPLYIYAKKASLRKPAAGAFVKFYLGHVADLAKRAGYVAPTAEDIAANGSALAAAVPPTTP